MSISVLDTQAPAARGPRACVVQISGEAPNNSCYRWRKMKDYFCDFRPAVFLSAAVRGE